MFALSLLAAVLQDTATMVTDTVAAAIAKTSHPTVTKGVLDQLLGGVSLTTFVVLMIYAGFGLLVNLLSEVRNQALALRKSGEKFVWKDWAIDNLLRFFVSFLLVPIFILGSAELLGVTVTPIIAFGIGYSADKLSIILKKRTGFGDTSESAVTLANLTTPPAPAPAEPLLCATCPYSTEVNPNTPVTPPTPSEPANSSAI